MLVEIQKLVDEVNRLGGHVELELKHQHRNLELTMNISYIAYKKAWITIHSDLAILRLKPGLITSIGNSITLYSRDAFTATITFPNSSNEEVTKLIDEEIRQLNKIFSITCDW